MTDAFIHNAAPALAVLAALLYLAAAWRQLLHLERHQNTLQTATAGVGVVAVLAHLVVAVLSGFAGELNLGFYRVASLIGLAMSSIAVIMLIRRPLHTLTIVVFPLSAMAVLISTFAPATGRPLSGLSEGLLWHVSASLTAFAVLSLSMVQGAMALFQSRLLRQHKTRGMVRWLPALDLSESMFYELLHAGFALLTLAMVAGGLFVDNMFSQQIAHKTVLTALSWLVYAVIVVVHWRSGWRMARAVNTAALGYGLLFLGFFGSKLVLELLLGQG